MANSHKLKYTGAEVDSLLDKASVSASTEYVDNEIATFDFIKIVDTLPTTGLPNRIYFVPKADTQTQDLFDEYAWINDKWEWITTKQIEVDLTDYYKKTEVDTALAAKQDSSTAVTNSNIGSKTAGYANYGNSNVYGAVGTACLRNIKASTTDLTAGTSTLATGTIYVVYE